MGWPCCCCWQVEGAEEGGPSYTNPLCVAALHDNAAMAELLASETKLAVNIKVPTEQHCC